MKKKPLHSIYDLSWSPRLIIEASAGTGKTYTIVGLFVRLLIEKKLDIDQVLVMTFTKKATSELRERIFTRLRDCLNQLKNPEKTDDNFLNEFAERIEDSKDAEQRLQNAIRNFDEAQVFTIHGFCQKVLSENALLAGSPFDFEVTQHDDMLHRAAEDFWRVFMYEHNDSDAGRYLINKLLSIAGTPEELIKELGDMFSKPYAIIESEVLDDAISYLEDVIAKRREIVKVWQSDKDEILRILNKCELSRFQQHLNSRLRKLCAFLEDDYLEIDTPDSLGYFRADYLYDEANHPKSKKTEPTEEHYFFELCEEYDDFITDIKKVKTTLIRRAFEDIKVRREKLSKNSGTVTYDDLLTKLDASLKDDVRGGALSDTLLKKYPYALVDEFQDTDPVQYSIFDSIYPENGSASGLMMIGDPKQAIYGFRGADIYTYFRAKKDGSGDLYTLNKNYRSRPALISAVNELFLEERKPFIEDEIIFFESEPGKKEIENEFRVDSDAPAALRIIARRGIEKSKKNSKDFAADQTVKQVADLLEKAERGGAAIKGQKLQAGDVAILVSGHKQAEEIKRRLKQVGVDAVTYSKQKVFETFEAKRLNLVMEAVLQPLNRKRQNNVLISGFFGLNLHDIYEIRENEESRQELAEELMRLRNTWNKHGFYPMFRSLLFTNGRLAGLAELSNSERIITNLYQLADICSKAEQSGGLDPNALHTWYLKELTDPDKDDEKTLLLESDQNLVKISTIHNSKGLEFPVVFCPSLWEGRIPSDKKVLKEYHTPVSDFVTINIDQSDTENRGLAIRKNRLENIAEEVRKMYVAVTRAKYQCVIIWDTHDTSNYSGLGASLIGNKLVMESVENNYKVKDGEKITDQTFLNRFRDLVQLQPDSIELQVLVEPEKRTEKVAWEDGQDSELNSKLYKGRMELTVQKKLESFSSLVHGKSDSGEPEYDREMENYVKALATDFESVSEPDMYNFPRGATPGTAIHKLFEHEDFDFSRVQETDHSDMIMEILDEYTIDRKWTGPVEKMLRNVTRSAIPGLRLEMVKKSDELREMEFLFPSGKTDRDSLFEIIRNGTSSAPKVPGLQNYMTGFIDLIVRQNGKYFIVDYKSNYLGDELEDYAPDKLKHEMEAAGYDLQYHLYTVAFLKYIRNRIPEFDYESQFGGVAYLFVRGMRPGSPNGIWFHKPEAGVIQQLKNELERV